MQTDIYKITMRNGLFMGILFSVNFMFTASRNMTLMLLSYVIIALIIWGTYRMASIYRDRESSGFISYWRAVYYIILVFFFSSIISAIFKIGYTTFINKEYLTQLFEEGMRQIESNRALFESLKLPIDEQYIDQLEQQYRPVPYAIQTIWVNILGGTLLGLILGGIVRRKKGLFDDNQPSQPQSEI